MFKPTQTMIIMVLFVLLGVALAATLGMTIYADRKSTEAAFIDLEVDRSNILNASGIVVPLLTQTPGIFEPTLTAIANLNTWKPVVKDFNGTAIVQVPAGCFFMGSALSPANLPISQQCFNEPFWIGQTEVTNAQYQLFMESDGYSNPDYWTEDGWTWRNSRAYATSDNDHSKPVVKWPPNMTNKQDQPVGGLSWYEAMAYTNWLTGRYHKAGFITSDKVVRLPTEAEAEYAARGPNSLQYPWGNEWVDSYLPNPVALVNSISKNVSWVGAFDMNGNLCEWTSSIYSSQFPYPYHADDGREALTSAEERVMRGCALPPLGQDAAHRYHVLPPDRGVFTGLRIEIGSSIPTS